MANPASNAAVFAGQPIATPSA